MKVSHNAPPSQHPIEKTSKTAPAVMKELEKTAEKSPSAKVELSESAQLIQKAVELTKASPDIRKDKIASLKASIKDGSYKVETSKIADKLVDDHLVAHFGKNSI